MALDHVACLVCERVYPVVNNVPLFDLPRGEASDKDSRREYWDLGWEARSGGDHAELGSLRTRDDWCEHIAAAVAASPNHVRHVETREAVVRDKVVLDIGCGGGVSSATFGFFGARYIGVDHSQQAAMQALRHLRSVEGRGFTAQANAEELPIRTSSIDVVYSNGVLHHTPNFVRTLDEAYRVLKPGGRAVIALYSTYSTLFGLLRLRGALVGNWSRSAMDAWMGSQTEGAWRTGERLNTWSETFSAHKLRRVVRKYAIRNLKFRKNGSPLGEIPRFGERLLHLPAAKRVDRALEPLLGSMIIMSFDK
jgi:SAM-dependent methyltransferase